MSNVPEISSSMPLSAFKPRTLKRFDNIPRKIQYACGLNVFDEWLNVDGFDHALMWHFSETGVPRHIAENVYKMDLLQRHPFADNTFDYAFCEDFIEHIDQKNAILFLSEVLRTLKPGGVLRLTSPGLEGVMSNHFRSAGFDAVIENHDSAYTRWGHLHFFSQSSLKTMALGLGFKEHSVCTFHQSWHRELCKLETRAEQNEYKINLYAELTK